MRRLRPSLLALTLLVPVASSTGCTAIGAAVGAAADHHQEKVVRPLGHAGAIHSLRAGAEVELRLRDGGVVRGRYRGLDWTLTDARVSRYLTAGRDLARDLDLPAPGPGASLALTRGAVASGELLGYGPAFVVFREEPERPPARVPLDRVMELRDAEGRRVTGSGLEEVLAAAPIPVLAGLRLEQTDGVTVVPSEDVAAVRRVERPHGSARVGLVFGALADAVFILYARNDDE